MLAPMPMATSPTFDRILASIILSQDTQGLGLGFVAEGLGFVKTILGGFKV